MLITAIKKELQRIINDIDTGNSNINEEDEMDILNFLNNITRRDEGMSKYSACQYLGVSRATFDGYVRAGYIPKGKHIIGFKELRFYKKDLDNFIKHHVII
jgi:predicted DNA-binding transcriptional regulator AlpA